jgi:glycine/D-amino acid oxidase-like deaminating enzyme
MRPHASRSANSNVQQRAGSSRCDSHNATGSDIDDAGMVAEILQVAASHLPALAPHLVPDNPTLLVRKAPRPSSCTSRPCIGPVVGCDGLFIASGHEGSGLTMALSTAEIVAALALGDKDLPNFANSFRW